jgi:2,3-bisphosphoglycerate-independent phosphoglycerate mutase
MVAHTGNFDATLKAVETINTQMKRLIDLTLQDNHILCVTSDHGNAEVLLDMTTGLPETKHNKSPVPFYLIANQFKKSQPQKPIRLPTIGMLADIAPTLLALMNLQKPKDMTGQNLLDFLLEV